MGDGNSSDGSEPKAGDTQPQGTHADSGADSASGQGAASAYLRLSSQMEQRLHHSPEDSPTGRL